VISWSTLGPKTGDDADTNETAYNNLRNQYEKLKDKGPIYTVADVNARFIYPNNPTEEETMGQYTMLENKDTIKN